MTEAFEQIVRLRNEIERVMQDGIFDAQLCERAKTFMDAAFDALDEAVAAQGKFEESP
jgi:hypothetical protein